MVKGGCLHASQRYRVTRFLPGIFLSTSTMPNTSAKRQKRFEEKKSSPFAVWK